MRRIADLPEVDHEYDARGWCIHCDHVRQIDETEPAKPTRASILAQAAHLIGTDRNSTYGEPADNLGRIAALWSTYLQRPVNARDVAWLMVLLKVAREIHAPHPDNPLDVAGYAAIAGEVG